MLSLKYNFNRGILFIRLNGILSKKTNYILKDKILPLILLSKVSNVIINLEKVSYIDSNSINLLIDISNCVFTI